MSARPRGRTATLSARHKTLHEYIDLLARQQFTGTLVVHFDKGFPEKTKQETMLKPEDMRQALRRPVFVVKSKPAEGGAPEPEETREEASDGDDDQGLV